MKNITKQKCPNCKQMTGVEIIYGKLNTLGEEYRQAGKAGDVVLGGLYRRWDWEEELINTSCLRCKHEWHAPWRPYDTPQPQQVRGALLYPTTLF